jgi:hypothetical protein
MIGVMKPEYKTGKKARELFERTMNALFRAPKPIAKKPQMPELKKKEAGD